MLVAHAIVVYDGSNGWLNGAEHFEASTRYLALADKAARTLVVMTERLDQHRGADSSKSRSNM
jgi:hypothetical protein